MDRYARLRELLDAHPAGAPASKAFDEILALLFSPDEASLAVHLTFAPRPASVVAAEAAITEGAARALLEAMADRGVVFARVKDGVAGYALFPTIPGLFEFPLMKAPPALARRLGALWERYHADGLGRSFAGQPTPLSRVVPVEKSLDTRVRVHPHEEVKRLIDGASFIALGKCSCRIGAGAHACRKPLEMCLMFDAIGRHLVSRGIAREIDATEAMAVLDWAELEGLVHTSTNSAGAATFICNCCGCCCTVLRGRTKLGLRDAFAPSGFYAVIDTSVCNGCGACVDDRCRVEAIALKNNVAVVDAAGCIGCGLCVTVCAPKALSLARRDPAPDLPKDTGELMMKAVTEKGRRDRFLKLLGR